MHVFQNQKIVSRLIPNKNWTKKSYFKTLTLILGNSDNDLLFPKKKSKQIICVTH